MSYQIPASRVTETYVAPCVSTTFEALSTKPVSPENWVEDFLQVLPGPGSIGFTKLLPATEQHVCPACRSESTEKLQHVPNLASWGLDYSCSCGADYSGDDIPEVGDDEWPMRRPEVTEQSKADYAYWRVRCAPAEAEAVYDEDHFLAAVVFPDGQRVSR